MTNRTLPAAPMGRPHAGVQCDLSPKAMQQWNPSIRAAAGDDSDNTITIYDPIGYDWWTGEGVTAKRIAAALRLIGSGNDVIVNINSPGGDVFEGLAIYNLLREHKGAVTVNILGIAASAASFIAMAGDTIRIGRAAFMMIHNAWVCACGDRNALREVAEWLEPFDTTIADIYEARTEIDNATIIGQMNTETWIGGKAAVEAGWADDFLQADQIATTSNEADKNVAARRLDAALARSGIPRSERRALAQEFKSSMQNAAGAGTPGATENDMPSAVSLKLEPLARLSFNSRKQA